MTLWFPTMMSSDQAAAAKAAKAAAAAAFPFSVLSRQFNKSNYVWPIHDGIVSAAKNGKSSSHSKPTRGSQIFSKKEEK